MANLVSSRSASEAKIRAMKASLSRWLKYRRIMDEVATGARTRRAILAAPGARPTPPAVLQATLRQERHFEENQLALHLHALLSEIMDASQLPSPDVEKDPDAAVKLALIAISGQLPGEAGTATPTGIIWMWPLLIVGGAVLIISAVVKNMADVAKEKERLRCIREGACTDSGFWIKIGAVAFLGWLAWDKLGLGAKITGAVAGGRRRKRR